MKQASTAAVVTVVCALVANDVVATKEILSYADETLAFHEGDASEASDPVPTPSDVEDELLDAIDARRAHEDLVEEIERLERTGRRVEAWALIGRHFTESEPDDGDAVVEAVKAQVGAGIDEEEELKSLYRPTARDRKSAPPTESGIAPIVRRHKVGKHDRYRMAKVNRPDRKIV